MVSIPAHVRDALHAAVAAVVTYRLGLEPEDPQHVATVEGSHYTYSTAKGFGFRTALRLEGWMEDECLAFADFQQSLQSWGGMPQYVGNQFVSGSLTASSLVMHLASVAAEARDVGGAIERLADAFDRARVPVVLTAFLAAGIAPGVDLTARFSNGVVLRRLSKTERERELCVFVSDGPAGRRVPWQTDVVLEEALELPLHFTPAGSQQGSYDDLLARIEAVHSALHAFKPGTCQIARYRLAAEHRAIPSCSFEFALGVAPQLPGTLGTAHEDLPGLEAFVSSCLLERRATLDLAMRRLRDAEGRQSASDSVVDALIGIEALLNSENSGELTLRIGLNCASLFPRKERLAYSTGHRNTTTSDSELKELVEHDGAAEARIVGGRKE